MYPLHTLLHLREKLGSVCNLQECHRLGCILEHSEQRRPLSEVKKSVEKLVERSTVAADARWRTQRESRRRPDLEEKDELGSLVMNAGRRMEVLRTFFDKHDPRRSDEAIQALWETCGGKCVEYAIEEDNLAFADLMDRLKSEFGEDPLELYKAEQRKGYRTTQLSAHRLRSHKDAIREAEEAYVNSAAEAKAIEERAAEMRRRRAGTGDSVAPKVKREPHTVKVKFWSDEKVMGLSLEHWHSATRPGVRYVRVVGIASESLAEEIVEVEKGMTIEAIDGVDVAELKERSAARRQTALFGEGQSPLPNLLESTPGNSKVSPKFEARRFVFDCIITQQHKM